MNDSECKDTYRQLVGMMANQHLDWIVTEVEERIAREEAVPLDEIRSKKQEQLTLFNKSSSVQIAPLPEKASEAQKHLIVLIDNIHHAIVHPAECQQFLARYLNRKGINEVIFLSPNGHGGKVNLDRDSVRKQLDVAKKLGNVLQSLRDTIIEEV